MTRPTKVLAIASAGGHFVQLCRLMPAWEGCDLRVASSDRALEREAAEAAQAAGLPAPRFHQVTEANRWQPVRLFRTVFNVTRLMVTFRPDVVVTTGAAPGYLALRMGRLIGARTIWIDSIANAEQLSLSGRKAGPHADLWLTQWSHLETESGPKYKGSVL